MINDGTKMNILRYKQCPACGASDIFAFYNYLELPAILFPINANKCDTVRKHPLVSYCCNECEHIFLNEIEQKFTKSIYEDYYYLYPFKNLESMQQPYREPFDRVVDLYLRKKSAALLEIGCDNVEQLEQFLKRGYDCTAINPGATQHNLVEFIDGFYGVTKLDKKFDYVISRFNLEHIIKFDDFFNALSDNLMPTGVAIAQVPNVEYFLKAGMLNVFAHEHPHYFCKTSLLILVRRYGFEVEFINGDIDPSLICVFSKRNQKYNPLQYLNVSLHTLVELQRVIQNACEKVVLYGAGLSLTGLLYSNTFSPELLQKIVVVDDNRFLWGKYMPNTSVQIMSPKEIELHTHSLIILVLGQQYHNAVYQRLINEERYQGKLMAISYGGLNEYKGGIE
ncbi:SAM-dependent methyltransferase [Candidatus Scalindua japonica]|uniref:SAM-dependent methyltransferase n=1 Tax=Candidatus Scalindua japonica TaxID=1284222 RepID=A0A286U184_9BACT|nr:class I SAM-dependent methyltransferase [Candidatus Scalindua japonica]GAX61877.1 SAM-dependent methyltransferase [Candidatus Scalindua japonica]